MNKKIRILTAIRQGQIGGGESHVVDLAENIDRSRYELIILSFTDGPMVEKIREMNFSCHVIYTKFAFDYRVWPKVTKLILDENIDIVHAHGTRAFSNVLRSCRKTKKPIVYTIHGWSFHEDQNLLRKSISIFSEQYFTQKASVNISVSSSNQATGFKYLKNFESKIVNNGVNLSKFRDAKTLKSVRQEFNFSKDDIVLGYFVRITKQKDPITLINAFQIALENSKFPLKLLIIGDGDLKKSVVSLVASKNLAEHVIFDNFREDVPNLLKTIDIYCLPSLWEGLSIGLLEAMAMKKAIIASRVDGTSEVISDRFNGLLINPLDTDGLARAIVELSASSKLRQRLSDNAFQTVEKKFSISNTVTNIESIYLGLISKEKLPLRIGIEAQRLLREHKHGMDIVALELINALQKIDRTTQYFVFTKKDKYFTAIKETANFKIIELPKAPYPIWEHFTLPKAIKKYKLDALHCTANTAPFRLKIPLILTLHDVIFLEKVNLIKGSLYQRLGNFYRRLLVPLIVKRATVIATVSDEENRKATLKLGLQPGFIKTLYNGVGSHFTEVSESEKEEVVKKYGLHHKFIFALANKDPRKNTKNIVLGFAAYNKTHPNVKLFISNIDRADLIEILQKNEQMAALKDIVTTGYLPNSELPAIYSAASLFLFPSLRESFGIPAIEAMACGTPVITSNISSLPEVAGNAGLLVNPLIPEEIGRAINKILSDPTYYRKLRLKGLERAANFTWETTAEKWVDIYKTMKR